MSNPARELHKLFTNWRGKGNVNGIDARGYTSSGPELIAENLIDASDYLKRTIDYIEKLRAMGRNIQPFERLLPHWTFGVFSYPKGWDANGVASLYNQHYLDVLELLADTIDTAFIVASNSETLTQIRAWLSDADELLAEDDSISEQLRHFLMQMLQEVRNAVSEEQVLGAFDLQAALERLWVGFFAASAQSTKDSGRWKNLAERLVWPTITGTLVALPSVTLQAIQLTQGGS